MEDKPFIIDCKIQIYAADEKSARQQSFSLTTPLFDDERVFVLTADVREGELAESS